jgi:hypothetical protein
MPGLDPFPLAPPTPAPPELVWPGRGFVLDLSIDTPTSAAALLGRLIPVSMVGTLDGKIIVIHRDETAADEPSAPPPLKD